MIPNPDWQTLTPDERKWFTRRLRHKKIHYQVRRLLYIPPRLAVIHAIITALWILIFQPNTFRAALEGYTYGLASMIFTYVYFSWLLGNLRRSIANLRRAA